MRVGDARSGKSLLKAVEVVADGFTVEVVDHPALAARCRTLDLLLGAAYLDGVDGGPVYHGVLEDGLAGSLFQGNVRSAERPARTTVHVHLDAQGLGDVLDGLQGLHPLGR